jgi:2'-5' RNA ligase
MAIRCFIAISIDDFDVKRSFQRFQRILESTGGDVKSVETENLHMTVKFLGDVAENKLPGVARRIEEISFDPFKIRVIGVGVFPHLGRPRVVWAGVEGEVDSLTRVYEEVEEKLQELGFKPERRGFHPHFTICRVRSGRQKARLIDEIMNYQDTKFGAITVDHISLMKSTLTPKGPLYTEIARSKIKSD